MDIYKFPEKIQFLLKASLQNLLWLNYYNVLCQQLNFTYWNNTLTEKVFILKIQDAV